MGFDKLHGGIILFLVLISCSSQQQHDHNSESSTDHLDYEIVLDTILQGYTDSTSWFYPSVGVIPKSEGELLVLTIQQWLTGKSDVFTPVVSAYSGDKGQNWSPLMDPNGAFKFRPGDDGFETGMCNFTIKWHDRSETLLGTCHSVPYQNKKLISGKRSPVWSIYDPEVHQWTKWEDLKLPDEAKFYETNACADQRVDLPNGDILLPIYYRGRDSIPFTTSVIRCSFDGENLQYQEQGNELKINIKRGLFEPSLTRYGDKYFLTMRNDEKGYWAISNDGVNFDSPEIWCFDDGQEVGTYNTMQHWVTHSEGLFLVYTRKGADNDYVVRHRAPLFMAEVDTASMQLIRESERIIVPNRGARIGNFSVVHVNEKETWVMVAELMVGQGEEQYGANGNVFAGRLLWDQPNKIWMQ